MAKDPAFLFYSSDFLSGVQDLTMEERGQYITLLCVQHQKGRLTDKMIKLAVADAAADVMAKFRHDQAGFWYNERLEEEIQKRRAHTQKQRERAKNGWEKRKNDATAHTTADAAALPLENENRNENENTEVNVKENLETDSTKIYPLHHCKLVALRDQSWVQKNRITPEAIDRFIEAMLKDGDYEKKPIDFKRHCRRWLDKQKQEQPTRKLNFL